MQARIALLPGDGIGPEVVEAAAQILQTIASRFGHTFELRAWPVGGAALRAGEPALPRATLEACLRADAILLGAVGDPAFDRAPADRRPETALLALRRTLGVYANLRPARLWPGLEHLSPLKAERVAGTDLLIVRELTGGLYFAEPRGIDASGDWAVNTMRYSAAEIERIAVVAFDAARARGRRVTLVDKANVLETSELWRRVVQHTAARYPDVTLNWMYVDACALNLVLAPNSFDVILTENLFGDILSDEAGAIIGSLGLLPSASIGGSVGLFEPVHGSAPSLAGTDTANPVGAIASAAMLLRYTFGAETEAQTIERAVGQAIADGCLTSDLTGVSGITPLSCFRMTAAIIERMEPSLRPSATSSGAAANA